MKRVFCLALVCLVGGLVAVPAASATPRYDQTCGLLPGEGGFSYVKVANMNCRAGKRVTNMARKKFCRMNNDCAIDWESNIQQVHRGTVRIGGWRCKVAVGWESLRSKCRKGKRRAIWAAGA